MPGLPIFPVEQGSPDDSKDDSGERQPLIEMVVESGQTVICIYSRSTELLCKETKNKVVQ